MTTLGAILLPSNPPGRLPDLARAADEAGLEQLWLWEDCFLSGGIAAAAAALASTTRLQVAIGILPVPFRNVALGKEHELVVFVPAATGPGAAERLAEQQNRYGMEDPGVAGDAKAVASGLERWIEAGATNVVLQPTTDDPDPEGFFRFVAQEVRPLLS